MSVNENRAAIEALLFASGDPISTERIAQALDIEPTEAEEQLLNLQLQYDQPEHGICLLHLENRWQFGTKTEFAGPVKFILETRRSAPLSQAALETLAIIAYNQPVSRGFVEQVRGVDSSSSVSGLLEKGLIEEAGRLDLPGHPVSFKTTDVFLRCFGLGSLAELPSLHEQDLPLEYLAKNGEMPDGEQIPLEDEL